MKQTTTMKPQQHTEAQHNTNETTTMKPQQHNNKTNNNNEPTTTQQRSTQQQ